MGELPKDIGKRIGPLADLPEELRAELQSKRLDELEQRIVNTIENRYNGVASVDEVLVGLYREFRVVYKRQIVAGKLYRMARAGMLESIARRRGIYRTLESKTNDDSGANAESN